jgi:glutaredoxin
VNLRPLGSSFAIGITIAALAACSPPEPSVPADEAQARSAPAESPRSAKGAAAATRPERMRASSSAEPSGGQFKYIDESGKLRLAARIEDIPERQRSTATPLEPPAARIPSPPPGDERRAIQSVDVTIYSTKYCGYCRAAMAHFEELGLDYVNHDVEEDELARAEYLELTGGRRGVPVIVVGDSWIQGWDRAEFERLLASNR